MRADLIKPASREADGSESWMRRLGVVLRVLDPRAGGRQRVRRLAIAIAMMAGRPLSLLLYATRVRFLRLTAPNSWPSGGGHLHFREDAHAWQGAPGLRCVCESAGVLSQ